MLYDLNASNRKVVPGLFQSSQATVLELWASPELLGPPWTQLDTSWGHMVTKRPDHQKVGVSRRAFAPDN